MLSGKLHAIFNPIKKAAWLMHCNRTKAAADDRIAQDAWYRKELVRGVGVYSTKQIVSNADFDLLCLHFATLSDDQRQIAYWSRAEERRALYQLSRTMNNAGVNWRYVGGIARNMNMLPADADPADAQRLISELPASLILKINAAVYLYWKRSGRLEQRRCA